MTVVLAALGVALVFAFAEAAWSRWHRGVER